jgi:tetratricopeptide (TPR) repeat protein
MISYAIDYHFFKLNPFFFHLKNILFHLLNTVLVYFLIKKISQNKIYISLFTALLFGIHPMHVESVAWIAERKDVLYTFYFLIGLLLYLQYLDKKNYVFLIGAALSFVLSTLAKSAAVVFPVILILIDFYEKRNLTVKSIIEKIPFFLYSVYIGLIAIRTQSQSNAIGDFQFFSFFEKVRFAAYGLMNYVVKFIVPVHLSSFHPYPDKNNISVVYNLALIAFLLIVAYLIFFGRKKRLLIFGAVFYLITVALVLQFISVGNAIIAERYTYVPYIGIGLIYAIILSEVFYGSKYKKYKYAVGVLLVIQLLFFAVTTYNRTKVWKDSATLWTDVIEKYPNESGAYSNRGHFYRTLNNYELALNDYNKAIQLDNKNHRAYSNRGKVWFDKGQIDKALADYNKSIEIDNKNAETFSNRGAAYGTLQQFNDALSDLNYALELDPNNVSALSNRGFVYYQMGEFEKNIADYTKYLQLKPNDADIINTIGLSYSNLKEFDKAISELNKSISINPKQGAFFMNRSFAFNGKGEKANALKDALQAQKLGYKVNDNYLNYLKNN